ncbi:MAG: amidohydrolase family protein [Litoreibacter sp.]|nr:amidohydrolase family protein [Litoreibacter sp.]
MTLPVSAPPRPATAPQKKAPEGAVDTHIHMLAAPEEFAPWENRVEDPAPMDMDGFLAAYRAQCATLGIRRTVVVHSIVYGADNAVTLEAIRRLGPDARGIGLLKDGASEAELDVLAEAGVRGLRLNYVHGGVLSWEGAKALAPALAARGMHLQMLVNADKHMEGLADEIRNFPCPVVFDHIGWPNVAAGPSEPGFAAMTRLVAEGAAYIKLSGLYRVSTEPWGDTDPLVSALVGANPERCLWGSDFPYIMLADAKMPDAGTALDAFHRVVTRTEDRQTILVDAPVALYGFED